MTDNPHIEDVAQLYNQLADNGPYGTLAPQYRGRRKSRYVAEVFDAALLDQLNARAKASDVLLDYGCGTGIFSIRAAHVVGSVVGIDISEEMLNWGRRLAKGQERITWMLGDGERIGLPDESMDWVVARESLCYVQPEKLQAMIEEIVRVMRPGAHFLWLEQTSDDPAFQRNPDAPLLEKRPLSKLLEISTVCGLEVDKAHCVRTPRFPWIYAVWMGLVPDNLIPTLARYEVAWHRRLGRIRGRRWRDVLIVLNKPI